jgi:hypothetical protein
MRDSIERIPLAATVVISTLIALLDLLGLLDEMPRLKDRIPIYTLLVLAALAGYLVVERAGKLGQIERSIADNAERMLRSLSGVEANLLSTSEEAFEYMAERVLQAQSKIDHAALAPPIERRSPSAKRWEQAIARILKGNQVLYRYVASFQDKARWERVKRHLTNASIQKYYVGHYEASAGTPPVLSFILIDDSEVIMHYPYETGQSEKFLSIKHPEVVELFVAYFRNIWNQSVRLNRDNIQRHEQKPTVSSHET